MNIPAGDPVVIAVCATVVTWVLVFPVAALLRRAAIVDRPNARSSHTQPTVRGAGIAIVLVLGSIIGSAGWIDGGWAYGLVAFVYAMLAVVSFVDDVRTVRPLVRFLTQGLAAAGGLAAVWESGPVVQIASVYLVGTVALAWVWIVGYTNAMNFMDGINGIAGMQAVVTGLGTAAIIHVVGIPTRHAAVLLALAVAGAGAGFLPHNFPRSRVFMGDVSSATLGFLLALLAVWAAKLTSPWVLIWLGLLHANFVLDTGITLVRRVRWGERWYEPHREHFYQRLVQAGYTHTQVTLAEFGLQALVAVALWWATPSTLTANAEGRMQNIEWIKMLAVAAGVVCVWLAFFAFAEVQFRRAQAGALKTGLAV